MANIVLHNRIANIIFRNNRESSVFKPGGGHQPTHFPKNNADIFSDVHPFNTISLKFEGGGHMVMTLGGIYGIFVKADITMIFFRKKWHTFRDGGHNVTIFSKRWRTFRDGGHNVTIFSKKWRTFRDGGQNVTIFSKKWRTYRDGGQNVTADIT